MLRSLSGLIFLLCLAFQAQAATVRINTVDTPVVHLINTSTYSLVVDSPSGDGTSESAPAKIYVPILSTATTDNTKYTTYSPAGNLPNGNAITNITGTLRFFLDTAAISGTEYLHAAIKDSSSSVYKVLGSTAVTVNQTGVNFDFTLVDMCTASAADLDCANLIDTSSPTTTVDALVYFFIASSQEGDGNTIDPSTKSDGVFYEVNLSNRIYSNTITMSALTKGDSRLTAVYQGFTFEQLNRIVAFDFGANGCQELYGDASSLGTDYVTEETATSGEAIIRPLNNDTSYQFAVYFEDKFKFSSKISNCIQGTPQEIEALLKKNSCFLLTAGFNGDHPIIDYFRKWRDEFLIQTYLGKKFIKFYYTWGPKMAPVVLSNPWLAKTVRGGAHVMYWVIEYGLWLFMLLFAMGLSFGTFVLVLNRKKEEELLHGRSQ